MNIFLYVGLFISVWLVWCVCGLLWFVYRLGDKNKASSFIQQAVDFFLISPVLITLSAWRYCEEKWSDIKKKHIEETKQ